MGPYGVMPEMLVPLYRGILLHGEGRYIDAFSKFQHASSILGRYAPLKELLLWKQSCMRLSGFSEVAEAFVKHETELREWGIRAKRLAPDQQPGVALLGMTAPTEFPAPITTQIGMALIDSLHNVTQKPVLAGETIATLREEYDLLLGIEGVKGTTWRSAPPLLLRDAITAHVEGSPERLSLRVCRVRDYSPARISAREVLLPAARKEWEEAIRQCLVSLFDSKSDGRSPWQAPPLIVRESKRELKDRLEQQVSHADYLKLLTYEPNPEYIDECGGSALIRWLAPRAPDDHPATPKLAFLNASLDVDKGVGVQKAFEPMAAKWPTSLYGVFARHNVLLCRLRPDNFAEIETQMSQVVTTYRELQSRPQDYYRAQPFTGMAQALSFALGKGGKPVDLRLNGGFLLANPRSLSGVSSQRTGWGVRFQDDSVIEPFTEASTPGKMRIDIEAGCARVAARGHKLGAIPVSFLLEVLRKNGEDSELTRYAVLKFGAHSLKQLEHQDHGANAEQALVRAYVGAVEDLRQRELLDTESAAKLIGKRRFQEPALDRIFAKLRSIPGQVPAAEKTPSGFDSYVNRMRALLQQTEEDSEDGSGP